LYLTFIYLPIAVPATLRYPNAAGATLRHPNADGARVHHPDGASVRHQDAVPEAARHRHQAMPELRRQVIFIFSPENIVKHVSLCFYYKSNVLLFSTFTGYGGYRG